MESRLESSWQSALATEFTKDYWPKLNSAVTTAYRTSTVYPPQALLFNAFKHCPLSAVKVVILGQDPYHGANQANGLAFSVANQVTIPPSLRNIYKEITTDLGLTPASSGDLERWAKQGVLLLNSTLTVAAGQPNSHQAFGWNKFTDAAIKAASEQKTGLVFLLWGKFAGGKAPLIDQTKHLILTAPHPSPFSAYSGFFGCRHFSRTNDFLKAYRQTPIDWR